jgi:hypothetical protein
LEILGQKREFKKEIIAENWIDSPQIYYNYTGKERNFAKIFDQFLRTY